MSIHNIEGPKNYKENSLKKKKRINNPKVEFVIQVLKQYAKENSIIIRSTSDLSPLEQWLLIKLYDTYKQSKETTTLARSNGTGKGTRQGVEEKGTG